MRRIQINLTLLLGLALTTGVAAMLAGAVRNAAAHRAAQAFDRLEDGEPARALERATAALAWHPYDISAQYTQLVAWKTLGRWDKLDQAARRARKWHPDGAALGQLAGEAAWRRGATGEAVEGLWDALWRVPTPPQTPAQVWRVALATGRKLWGDGDPRIAAAAVRVLTLLDQDVTMKNPAIRGAAVAEAAEALRAAGAPLTAGVAVCSGRLAGL